MRYWEASSWLSSTFTLPTLARPAYSSASCSMLGPIIRHGPHHTAQKSTSTGTLLPSTSLCQLSLVNSMTFLVATGVTFLSRCRRQQRHEFDFRVPPEL